MTKIKILPEIVSNKIAAGEVVERPASVVKELVENALDAGSSKVFIEVEKGGKSLIRVSDNGTGMNKDDALLSIERYATSKIYNDSDLYSISTLGFRGEALPSIAAVSRFSLLTKENNSEVGTEIIVHGGKITKVSDAGTPSGTMITVGQLFYNTPARRKFLKTIATEMGHISDVVAAIALGRPDVRFKLTHETKAIKDWPVASDPIDRAINVLGRDLKDSLLPINLENQILSVKGWIAVPQFSRSTSRGIYVYVNNRHVRDRVIQHALFAGYGRRLMKGRFPLSVLFINVPFDHVDVNVHPAKHEVRFERQNDVHDLLKQAVSQTLDTLGRAKWGRQAAENEDETNRVSETVRYYGKEDKKRVSDETAEDRHAEKIDSQTAVQANFWEEKRFGYLRVIGQLHNTYILCESESGLVLVDQHAAHERILFEQMKKRSKEQDTIVQKLLMPETIEMGYKEAGILEKLIPDLEQAGVEIEPFGKDTFVVKAVPAILSGIDIKPVIFDIVEKVADIGFTPGMQETIDTCLVFIACHGAIRANQPLTDEQLQDLIKQLDHCDQPSNCPHGRPTWISWSSAFLEKSFGRTG